jgi:hypothetical protein
MPVDPPDFPAAHSMDSCWFAVDDQGQVAYFDTGEGGAIPTDDTFPKGGEAGGADPLDLDAVVCALLERRAASHPALSDLLFDKADWRLRLGTGLWEVDRAALVGLLAWLGLYSFDCDAPHAAPYVRGAWVPDPITIDALPPALRERIAAARLPVVFAGAPRVAVPALVPAAGWGDPWEDLDGKLHRFDGGDFHDEDDWAEGAGLDAAGDGGVVLEDEAALRVIADLLQADPPHEPPPPPPPEGGLFAWFKRLFHS